MERLIATGTVPVGEGDTYPVSGTPGQATSGNPAATPPVPPTINPAYASNMLIEEIRACVVAAGIAPSGADWTQLLQALMIFGSQQMFAFDAAGEGTFNPPADWTRCGALVIGGGGAGGNGDGGSGGGGQSGAAVFTYVTFAAGTALPYVVGGGGEAGSEAGGTSTACGATAVGGAGGMAGAAGASFAQGGSSGGQASGGIINLGGAVGGQGVAVETLWQSGTGGASLIAQGGIGAYGDGTFSSVGITGQGPGAGGSGGVLDGASGIGIPGIVIFFGTAAT